MIYYRPTDGGPHAGPIRWRPRTAFVMQQLSDSTPDEVHGARKVVDNVLKAANHDTVDAAALTTGGDFLLKIWQLAVTCPIGIAIVQEGIEGPTLANIYYELGLMQAYGRETVVVRVGKPKLPSDLVRTEYLNADERLESRLKGLLGEYQERARNYELMADLLENDPLLSIDFLRRAFLLTGRIELRTRAEAVFGEHGLERRAGGSVERMLVKF